MISPHEPSLLYSDHGKIVLYQAKDGQTTLDVQLRGETVWLTQAQMAELFERDQSVISRHVTNVFKEGELPKQSNMQKMHIALSDKPIALYNLDVIISVGYRVKSQRGLASVVRFDDKALVALALLIAASDPPRKELMIRLIVNLLNNNPAQITTEVSDG